MSVRTTLVILAGSLLISTGCSKKEPEVQIAASASALAPSAPPPSANVVKYVVDPSSKTSIDMPAPKEHIKAGTTAAGGSLDVDLMNFANTRGEVKIDLTTLETHTFANNAKDNASQTTHAHNWLEVGDLVSPDDREKNRWVVYAIRSLDGLSATDASKVAPVAEGEEDVRTITGTAHGELLLHGHKVDREAQIEAKLHYPKGAPASAKPTSIVVSSKTPLHVVLAEHDVKPRDNVGKLAESAFDLLGTKVANVADVSFELKTAPK